MGEEKKNCENCEDMDRSGIETAGFACLYFEMMNVMHYFLAGKYFNDSEKLHIIEEIITSCFQMGECQYPNFDNALKETPGIRDKIKKEIESVENFMIKRIKH